MHHHACQIFWRVQTLHSGCMLPPEDMLVLCRGGGGGSWCAKGCCSLHECQGTKEDARLGARLQQAVVNLKPRCSYQNMRTQLDLCTI